MSSRKIHFISIQMSLESTADIFKVLFRRLKIAILPQSKSLFQTLVIVLQETFQLHPLLRVVGHHRPSAEAIFAMFRNLWTGILHILRLVVEVSSYDRGSWSHHRANMFRRLLKLRQSRTAHRGGNFSNAHQLSGRKQFNMIAAASLKEISAKNLLCSSQKVTCTVVQSSLVVTSETKAVIEGIR